MPARSPSVTRTVALRLAALGRRIRAHRKGLRISGAEAAEAAGLSRVTLHRIEKGEPSVSMGAWLDVVAALGLDLDLLDGRIPRTPTEAAAGLPDKIRLSDYPQLKRLAWQRKKIDQIDPQTALALYERNWRHVDRRALDAKERELVRMLSDALGGGRLLV